MNYLIPYNVEYLKHENEMYPVFRDLFGNIIPFEDFQSLMVKAKEFYDMPNAEELIAEQNKYAKLIFQLKLRYGTMKGDDDYDPYKSLFKLKYPEPLYEYETFKKDRARTIKCSNCNKIIPNSAGNGRYRIDDLYFKIKGNGCSVECIEAFWYEKIKVWIVENAFEEYFD